MATKRKGGGIYRPFDRPDGEIRLSQVVSTYGAGSVIDLVDSAVLVGGLDFWTGPFRSIEEPRLRDSLAERFKKIGRELSIEGAFREPPAGDEKEPSKAIGIQCLEFPRWFVCQTCRSLMRGDQLDFKKSSRRYVHHCGPKTPSDAVPVRFVAACRRGHLQDLPWIWLAHRDGQICASPSLKLIEGPSGDFSDIFVECSSCEAPSQRLSTFMVQETAPGCGGHRPWLGTAEETCEEKMKLLIRTASNAYFPQTESALSIPEPGREVENAVEQQWQILQAATKDTLPSFREIPAVHAAIGTFADEDVLAAVEARKSGVPAVREPLRTAEYRQFLDAPVERPGELPPRDADFFARKAKDADLPSGIEQLILAPKLREVRTQIGFTRFQSISPDLQGEFDMEVEPAALGLDTKWLPASEVRGEGVLLIFDEKALAAWEQRSAVKKRNAELRAGHDAEFQGNEHRPPFPGVRFYMLHSLAHLLISAISLECGYSASAIRERIYCSDSEGLSMAGILLSTGTNGSEGTLGGLVEQGRRIRSHLRRAYELALLCSNDPVCAGHSPHGDLSERNLEGAACHACLYIAETSCERWNRYLDRALVVPTLGHADELAFIGERP